MQLTGAWDTAAWWISMLSVLGLPVALIWVVIHPFASFWRRIGAVWAYLTVCALVAVIIMVVWLARDTIMDVRFGVQIPLVVFGIVVFAAGFYVGLQRMKQLASPTTLLGGPELSRHDRGTLLTQGIYARIRHPRYVEVTLGYWGFALFANTFAAYVAATLLAPFLYIIVLLEERELRERFGQAYTAYAARVPRFIPHT